MMVRLRRRQQMRKRSEALYRRQIMLLKNLRRGDGRVGNPVQQFLLGLKQLFRGNDGQPFHEGRITGNFVIAPAVDGLAGAQRLKQRCGFHFSPEHQQAFRPLLRLRLLRRLQRKGSRETSKNLEGAADDVLIIDPSDEGVSGIQAIRMRCGHVVVARWNFSCGSGHQGNT